ncbi:MAG: aminotransferase class I/II-fold pyridoxal phosphate-dependent enzyme [Planctomycetales bacterium]|nr:aminotransferase class I/II-fold pyridoxal phosphate-dependent enzyme [Planctomycetales bacterium]
MATRATRPPSDFRSDTVTRPSAEMRKAMAEAEVGDDGFGDDPTVRRLEERVAETLGKEAAVFVPSGTMGNQVAIRVLTSPGDEVVVEAESHTVLYELAGPAVISGVQLRPVPGEGGVLAPDAVEAAFRPADAHAPPTSLLVVENTHTVAGGRIVPLERFRALVGVARRRGARVHLDGARLWNAEAATGVPAREWAALADTAMVSMSKGLGAPVGSLLAGSRETIAAARRVRKMLGGGMRQAGVLAAAALVGLERNRPRLGEDHARARRLAAGLADVAGCRADPGAVETNIVLARTATGAAPGVVQGLAARGVLAVPMGPETVRFVTHVDVGDVDVERAIAEARDTARR